MRPVKNVVNELSNTASNAGKNTRTITTLYNKKMQGKTISYPLRDQRFPFNSMLGNIRLSLEKTDFIFTKPCHNIIDLRS